MRTTALALSLLLTLGLAAALLAEDDATDTAAPSPDAVVYDSASAFAFFKSMAGDWEGASTGQDHSATARTVNVKVSAAGSLVLQTLYPGDAYEMINAIHMDGDDLLLTHYCAAQNAPVMKFEKSDQPGEIRFAFAGGTNFDPAVDVHAHDGVFHVKDKDTIESDFVTFANGQARPVIHGILKRKAQ